MLNKETEPRQATELLRTDMLVPNNHLLRKIDAAVDFTHIYDLVEDLYCEDNDRPSCDPVVLGYTMSQPLPHFATISYAFRYRFTANVIECVFRRVLEEVAPLTG